MNRMEANDLLHAVKHGKQATELQILDALAITGDLDATRYPTLDESETARSRVDIMALRDIGGWHGVRA